MLAHENCAARHLGMLACASMPKWTARNQDAASPACALGLYMLCTPESFCCLTSQVAAAIPLLLF